MVIHTVIFALYFIKGMYWMINIQLSPQGEMDICVKYILAGLYHLYFESYMWLPWNPTNIQRTDMWQNGLQILLCCSYEICPSFWYCEILEATIRSYVDFLIISQTKMWIVRICAINSLAYGKLEFNSRYIAYRLILVIDNGGIAYEITFRRLLMNLTDAKSQFAIVMACCRQASSCLYLFHG